MQCLVLFSGRGDQSWGKNEWSVFLVLFCGRGNQSGGGGNECCVLWCFADGKIKAGERMNAIYMCCFVEGELCSLGKNECCLLPCFVEGEKILAGGRISALSLFFWGGGRGGRESIAGIRMVAVYVSLLFINYAVSQC